MNNLSISNPSVKDILTKKLHIFKAFLKLNQSIILLLSI